MSDTTHTETTHRREATTPLPNGTLLADCSCGATYSVPQGGNEFAALEAAHRVHAEGFPVGQRVRTTTDAPSAWPGDDFSAPAGSFGTIVDRRDRWNSYGVLLDGDPYGLPASYRADELASVEGVPEWVTSGIARVLAPRPGIPSRYPYTYAYDFLRSHPEEFGVPEDVTSRAEMSRWVRERFGLEAGHPLLMAALRQFADAYLAEHNTVLTEEQKETAR